jgi:uncharacterized membrane protein
MLFGQASDVGFPPAATANMVFGACCMLAVAAGLARVLWRWRTVSRAEQLLAAVIVGNIALYLISTLASLKSPHDLVAVVPCGAILAARALVPDRLPDWRKALVVCAVAVGVALVPLSAVAVDSKPPAGAFAILIGWLRGQGLRYGLSGYWQSSATSLESGGQVQVRTIVVTGREIHPYYWEGNLLWYDPAQNYANFVLVDTTQAGLLTSWERAFGRPAATHRVGSIEVLIYHRNLLTQVTPGHRPSLS